MCSTVPLFSSHRRIKPAFEKNNMGDKGSEPDDELSTTLVSENEGKQKKLLCKECQLLNLTVDNFIIQAESSTINLNYSQRYQPRKAEKSFYVKSGRNRDPFKTIKKLRVSHKTCNLCDLIYRAITRYGNDVNDDTPCSLYWEVHGREPRHGGDGSVKKTRRMRLTWIEVSGNRHEIYLILVAPHNPLRPNSDATASQYKNNHFLGRGSGDQKEKQALIKSWINLCTQGHELCQDNHDTDEAFSNLMEESYFGVIDVADMQLKSLPRQTNGTPEPYVALSYVWGRPSQHEPPYITNRRTIMTHICHGGLETPWEKLPQTIQDAILITSRLGYRYLWIDALCIVQDSKSSWQLNASAMHLIYGNAQFTICAADGKDSSAGLRAVRSVLRATRPATDPYEALASVSSLRNFDEVDLQPLNAECAPSVRLMVSRPLEAVIDNSVWSKRAWTLQERILSRRCLIFAEGRVYWQCRSIGISEDIHTDGSSKGLSLDPITSPLRTLQELQGRPLRSYMSYVSMYTGRSLTKQRDALAAFRGISWLLERYMDTTFLFGLPASHFDLVILWGLTEALSPSRPVHEAQPGQQPCTTDKLGNCTCRAEQDFFGREDLPTWAWAGWMGFKMEFQPGMLEGCLENVREWLTCHTWIEWYIRDEKGHLQPLSDLVSSSAFLPTQRSNSKEDDIWGGYSLSRPPLPTFGRPLRHPPPPPNSPPPNHYDDYSPGNPSVWPPGGRHRPLQYNQEPDNQGRTLPKREYRDESPPRRKEGAHFPRQKDGRNRVSLQRKEQGRGPSQKEGRNRSRSGRHVRIASRSSSSSSPADTDENYDDDMYHSPTERPPSFEDLYEGIPQYISAPLPTSAVAQSSATIAVQYERRDNARYTGGAGPWNDDSTPQDPAVQASSSDPPMLDGYGRLIPSRIYKKSKTLDAILPDSPFGVIRRTPGQRPMLSNSQHFMPILQFRTWRKELCVMARDISDVSSTKTVGAGLRRCDIVDAEGDWCGDIVLGESYIDRLDGHLCTFIAMSEAKGFTMEECPAWTYYIPKERDESEWDLYYVLLLERNEERGLWERAGLGKVFQAAFYDNVWAEIKLG